MRLTQRGIGLLISCAALLGAGFVFGYPELTVLGTAGMCAAGFAFGYAAWRARLTVTRRADPDRVMRGEASRVTLTVHNSGRLLPSAPLARPLLPFAPLTRPLLPFAPLTRPLLTATLIAYDRCGPVMVPVPLVRLHPGRDSLVEYPVPTSRRGVVEIGPLRVVRTDPLGLVTSTRSHGEASLVWVYPRVHPLAAVPVGVVRSLDGRVDRVPHGTITFDTLREYVVGDELRHVHWRTTARIGQLMVREHVDTSLPRLVILLDDRAMAYPRPDDFEAACEAAASLVVAAAREELPLVLTPVSGGSPIGSEGRRVISTRPYLDRLAEAAPRDGPDLTLARATARLRQRRLGDTLIYLTGPGAVRDIGEIGTLRGGYPTIVVGALGGAEPITSTVEGLLVLAAADGADFAAEWDGVRTW